MASAHGPSPPIKARENRGSKDYRSNDNRDDDIEWYWSYNCCIIDNYWWILLITTIAYHSTGESILVCLKCSRKNSNSSSFSPVKFPNLWTNLPSLAPGIPTWGNATWFPMRSMGTKSLSTISWDLAVASLAVWLCGFSLVSKSFRVTKSTMMMICHLWRLTQQGPASPWMFQVWKTSCLNFEHPLILHPDHPTAIYATKNGTIWISTGCHPTMVSRIRHPSIPHPSPHPAPVQSSSCSSWSCCVVKHRRPSAPPQLAAT